MRLQNVKELLDSLHDFAEPVWNMVAMPKGERGQDSAAQMSPAKKGVAGVNLT